MASLFCLKLFAQDFDDVSLTNEEVKGQLAVSILEVISANAGIVEEDLRIEVLPVRPPDGIWMEEKYIFRFYNQNTDELIKVVMIKSNENPNPNIRDSQRSRQRHRQRYRENPRRTSRYMPTSSRTRDRSEESRSKYSISIISAAPGDSGPLPYSIQWSEVDTSLIGARKQYYFHEVEFNAFRNFPLTFLSNGSQRLSLFAAMTGFYHLEQDYQDDFSSFAVSVGFEFEPFGANAIVRNYLSFSIGTSFSNSIPMHEYVKDIQQERPHTLTQVFFDIKVGVNVGDIVALSGRTGPVVDFLQGVYLEFGNVLHRSGAYGTFPALCSDGLDGGLQSESLCPRKGGSDYYGFVLKFRW